MLADLIHDSVPGMESLQLRMLLLLLLLFGSVQRGPTRPITACGRLPDTARGLRVRAYARAAVCAQDAVHALLLHVDTQFTQQHHVGQQTLVFYFF